MKSRNLRKGVSRGDVSPLNHPARENGQKHQFWRLIAPSDFASANFSCSHNCVLLFNLDPLNLYFSISKFFYLNWILKIYQVHPPTYTLLENIHWKLLSLPICTLTTHHIIHIFNSDIQGVLGGLLRCLFLPPQF